MPLRLQVWLAAPSRWIEPLLAWATVVLVLFTFALVGARYLFAFGSIAGQELTLWIHASVFMLGAAVALRTGKHVRVDVFYQRAGPRAQAWIDLAGLVLLVLPFAVFMGWISLDYVRASWQIGEASREPGGLPALYLLKSLIPATAALLILQALAECAKAIAQLRDDAA